MSSTHETDSALDRLIRATYFSGYRNGNYSPALTGGAWHTVQLNAETLDPGNDYNPATYQWTCPVTGIYHFSAALMIYPQVAQDVLAGILLNGGEYARCWKTQLAIGEALSMPISTVLPVNVGTLVTLGMQSNVTHSTSTIYGSLAWTYLHAHRIA